MSWATTDRLEAALLCLVACGGLGWQALRLVARLPEPRSEPEQGAGESDRLFSRSLPPPPDKEPYAAIAARPGLAVKVALSSALVGACVGLAVGLGGALAYLVPLVPVGMVLLVVDWRTTLLPTRIIHPTYVLLAVLIPVAALLDHDLTSLYRAGWGWLLVGGWFWVFWWLLGAWGFGDVRLARVLGPALGYLGWDQLVVGLFLVLLVGGLGGVVLGIAHRSLRRRFPYGPFMLVGAFLGVVLGPWLAAGLGY